MAMTEQDDRRLNPYSGDDGLKGRPWPPAPMPVFPYVIARPGVPWPSDVGGPLEPVSPTVAARELSPPPAPVSPAVVPPPAAPTVTPSPVPSDQALFGSMIREARERRGITQLELARLVGRSRSFIALVEQGRRRASDEDVRKLREVLGIGAAESADSGSSTGGPPRR